MAIESGIDTQQLDAMRADYKTAVAGWITSIQREAALTSDDHSVLQVDAWEQAGFQEESFRNRAKAAKKKYEEAIRSKLYHFDAK